MKSPSPAPVRAATIIDVAREADVSVRTVSRVLNKSPKVGEATRAAIEQTIARLEFRPSLRARGLVARRSFLLGLIQGDRNTHVLGLLQHGVVETCSEAGYELLIHPVIVQDPALGPNLEEFVRRTEVDGVLLLPPVAEQPGLSPLLARLGVPAVAMAAARLPDYPATLVTDERAAAAAVAEHLLALGHRRVALVTGPPAFLSAREREQGFRAALDRAGVALPPAYVREGDYRFDSGLAAAADLLALGEPPTAIFASNDVMAAAVLKVAHGHGLAVPDDLSVVGFDDSELASMLTPALTTIHRPLHAIAREATRRLIGLVEGTQASLPTGEEIGLSLVARQSTAPPR